jgi:hypothetical protein
MKKTGNTTLIIGKSNHSIRGSLAMKNWFHIHKKLAKKYLCNGGSKGDATLKVQMR